MIHSQAVLLAIGIGWDGRRSILAVELANRESRSSWRDSCSSCASGASQASSSWSPTTMPGSDRPSSRSCRRRLGSAATCTSSGTPWTTCRARSMTTACANSGGSMTGATSPRPGAIWRPGLPVAGDLRQAVRLGRGAYRGDPDLLPAAPSASQAPQVDQPPGTPERGDQTAHPGRAHLSQRRELLTPGPGPRSGDARELAGSAPLPQHGRPARAQEGGPAHGGLNPNHLALWTTLRVAHKAHHRNHDRICRELWTQLTGTEWAK